MSNGYKMKLAVGLGAGGLCVVVAMAAIAMARAARPQSQAVSAAEPERKNENDNDFERDDDPIQVKTVRPKLNPNFTATVEQPAYVIAYYADDLMARAAGPVKFLKVAIGEHVTKGQRLLEVDVPDIAQEVVQKAAVIKQREQEKAQAESLVRVAEAYVKARDAWRDFKLAEYNRFKRLAMGPSPAATQDIVDERYKDYLVADAERLEALEKVASARIDVKFKEALIDVAKADYTHADEVLKLATITAPYDGVITRRNINPGGFVHNASTTSVAEPLLRVERTDIVTVYMKVPDRYVDFIDPSTEAIIEMNALPGYRIRGKVTRYSDSLQNEEKDRTMRVEVDLYNGSRQAYEKFLAQEKATNQEDLKTGPLPWFPTIEGGSSSERPKLKSGMYGTMTLVLRKFDKAMLLPMSAVVPRGGKNYVFIVKDGHAHLVPISVDVENGTVAKVTLLVRDGDHESVQEFTGKEEIVITNQGELSDGQKVTPTHTEW
jgi:multidrug efflux pump subunit AcrA (membrane-fusion protein)